MEFANGTQQNNPAATSGGALRFRFVVQLQGSAIQLYTLRLNGRCRIGVRQLAQKCRSAANLQFAIGQRLTGPLRVPRRPATGRSSAKRGN